MEQILKITQNKMIETPNAQNMVDCGVESQENFNRNRNRNTKFGERSENIKTRESEQNRNDFELPRPVPQKSMKKGNSNYSRK